MGLAPERWAGGGHSGEGEGGASDKCAFCTVFTFDSSAPPQSATTCFTLGALDFTIPGVLARGTPPPSYKTQTETTQERGKMLG